MDFSIGFDVQFLSFPSSGSTPVTLFSTVTGDVQEVQDLFYVDYTYNNLPISDLPQFYPEYLSRQFSITATQAGGVDFTLGQGYQSVDCNPAAFPLAVGETYHVVVRFDLASRSGSIVLVWNNNSQILSCGNNGLLTRPVGGLQDMLLMGTSVQGWNINTLVNPTIGYIPSPATTPQFNGYISRVALWNHAITDLSAFIRYDGLAATKLGTNLLIVSNSVTILPVNFCENFPENPATSLTSADYPYPFMFWRQSVNCPASSSGPCYHYFAGFLNSLTAETGYEVRASWDFYVSCIYC